MWVDDSGTCWDSNEKKERHPRCRGGYFHIYQLDNGSSIAMRCPVSLSKAEQERVFSTSEADKTRLVKYREFLRLQKTSRTTPREVER